MLYALSTLRRHGSQRWSGVCEFDSLLRKKCTFFFVIDALLSNKLKKN